MKKVIRASYRGTLKGSVTENELRIAGAACGSVLQQKIKEGTLLTGGIFYYKKLVFLYTEYVAEETPVLRGLPEAWFPQMNECLELWPEYEGAVHWVYMLPVFYSDEPGDVDSWKRSVPPDARCGRIALLYDDKVYSYLTHHTALVKEGLLQGDRYQFISYHENLLFSYYETPRDREVVNILRSEKPSKEIGEWLAQNPESHFWHFPEAKGDNFMVIKTLCDC